MNPPAARPLSPHLQVYRMLLTMVLSMTHRVSGLYLSLCSLLLVAWLAAVAAGPEAYAATASFLATLPMRIVLGLALAAFWYHLFAGLRHLAWDIDLGFEMPTPFWTGLVVLALTAVAVAATLWLTPAGRWLLAAT